MNTIPDPYHDPDLRGMFMTECEHCRHRRVCRLEMSGNRYLWKCVGRCIPIEVA